MFKKGDKIRGKYSGIVYEIKYITRDGDAVTTSGATIYGINDNKGFEKVKTIKTYWIARDLNGKLFVYTNEPIRDSRFFKSKSGGMRWIDGRYEEKLSDITWENSPYRLDLEV